ncbi:tubulin--tyrosine ligase-like protein 12 isoform X1 [Punica granatum]|uniref:Tubulin--tyrosine ligase-like protein 12 isoform X1 n=2 Tax=Punica granatum TaxID=22663 RepID=A0A6P8BV41_PUNGR|nr:tubulin--tyrosine ligase-like protein 12 isoform X1 [Punica granatum]PKI43487.1 hypothetical protein CRG98_036089 [Punica granatum]
MASVPNKIRTFDDFVRVHELLLTATGLPPQLHGPLFEKLSAETFDGGAYFQIEPADDEGRQRRLVMTADFMGKDSNVFLVDHAWTFRLSDAYKQLQEVPGLAQRMGSIMCVDIDLDTDAEAANYPLDAHSHEDVVKVSAADLVAEELTKAKENGDSVRWLELEELDINDETLVSLNLSSKFPDLLALSLCCNKLESVDVVAREVAKFNKLRALWLNDNPITNISDGYVTDKILQASPKLEILNSHFTRNFGQWALAFCGGLYDKDNPGHPVESDHHPLQSVTSLDLSNRCIHNLVDSKAFSPAEMPSLSHLNLRGNPLNENSASDMLKVLEGFPTLNSLEVDIPGPLGESAIMLLESLPNLSQLNGVDAAKILEAGRHIIDSILEPRLPEWTLGEPLVDRITNAMWLYLMTYRLANEEKIDETSVWYVMDELGSALRHSDEPNFMVAPFLYMPEGKLSSAVSFSLLWPIRDLVKGDECTRDFLYGIGEDKQRSARLTAWFQTPQNYFIHEYEKHRQNLDSRSLTPASSEAPSTRSLLKGDKSVLRVYTDIPHVEEFLTRPEFVITSDPTGADIIWTSLQVDEDMKKTTGITDQQYINQFPFEACLVMKHHLAETVQKAYGSPEWLQPTYNLETHLTQLIGNYYVRERDGLNNLWILKPWNMARTIDTTVTSNISAIIRVMETGPKICQKYIEHPALFNGRKFDLRFIVLVRSMNPLEIFLADIFWVRLANNQYSLDRHSLFEYETHFTVMNYRGTINHKNTNEFVKEFEEEHGVKWLDIHERIRKMVRSVFEAAAGVHPEMHSPMSRAIYGIDVMLDSNFRPKLLEITYCPDCTRACKYDMEAVDGKGRIIKASNFFNYVFGCLFLNETAHVSPL